MFATPVAEAERGEKRFCVVVPAHNEAGLIVACIRSIRGSAELVSDPVDLVVVADNCADQTAALARAEGATVLERHVPKLPGKPHALAWALSRLSVAPYDAFVFVDADTVVPPEFLPGLLAAKPARDEALQPYNASSNEAESWLTRLGGLFTRMRYEVDFPRRARRGLNIPLTGNGMCLGTDLLRQGWPALSLTEDLEWYARLTASGIRIRMAPTARVLSQGARSLTQGASQRLRWARGRTSVLRVWWRPLVTSRRIGWRQKLDALRTLALPGPATLLWCAIAGTALAWRLLSSPWSLAVTAVAGLAILPIVRDTLLALWRHPEPLPVIRALAFLPIYLVWRLWISVRAVVGPRDRTWRRTARHADPAGSGTGFGDGPH